MRLLPLVLLVLPLSLAAIDYCANRGHHRNISSLISRERVNISHWDAQKECIPICGQSISSRTPPMIRYPPGHAESQQHLQLLRRYEMTIQDRSGVILIRLISSFSVLLVGVAGCAVIARFVQNLTAIGSRHPA
jgi:hypothetical protein